MLTLRKHKKVLLVNALFWGLLLGGNPIAQSLGWIPAKYLYRQVRVRARRAGRRFGELFIEDDENPQE
ncbi:hypothetical protein V8V91_08685 [Algoriphagus halophilus]|uniref:hypothetical protein n=1 Tax=Algoriphagus halophilus TaxID=226505 RepID=UPI00358FC65E